MVTNNGTVSSLWEGQNRDKNGRLYKTIVHKDLNPPLGKMFLNRKTTVEGLFTDFSPSNWFLFG